jgi:acetylornithine deacetylase/succinyl-diaminopimelate desuccinylase-like protein
VAAAVGSGGGSDGNHVADLTPTLDGLGVLGGMLHQPGEWADWKSFPDRSRVAADLIMDLCAGAGDAG